MQLFGYLISGSMDSIEMAMLLIVTAVTIVPIVPIVVRETITARGVVEPVNNKLQTAERDTTWHASR